MLKSELFAGINGVFYHSLSLLQRGVGNYGRVREKQQFMIPGNFKRSIVGQYISRREQTFFQASVGIQAEWAVVVALQA